jgi:hypothetical protein
MESTSQRPFDDFTVALLVASHGRRLPVVEDEQLGTAEPTWACAPQKKSPVM